MNDKAFEEMIARKQKEADKPGYGARCAAKAVGASKKRGHMRGNIQELILS